MKTTKTILQLALFAALLCSVTTSCESTGDGGGSVSGEVYYGSGWNDPWYYGYYDRGDIIVTPPPRPDRPDPPVATQLPAAVPSPQPMPSIPSTPRPMAQPATRR